MAFELYFSISRPVLQIAAIALTAGAGVYIIQDIKKKKEVQEQLNSVIDSMMD